MTSRQTPMPAPNHLVPSIAAEDFDNELASGSDIVVVDVRPRDAFEGWRVDAGDGRLLNFPIDELDASIGKVRSATEGRPVRVLCAAGISSVDATQRIIEAGIPATNVEGGMIAWSRILRESEVPGAGEATVVQFRREARGCLSYLVVSGIEALVVDPAPEVDPYLQRAESLGASVVAVFDSHIHADHISGARQLSALPGATLYMSRECLGRGFQVRGDYCQLVESGDEIVFGSTAAKVMGLPGHTTEMSGLLIGGNLFTGDSVFAEGVARPDLQDASPEASREAARTLHRTIRERILTLPPTTKILTCHYPGGRLDGPLAPRLDEVIKAVPELSLSEDEFVARLVQDLPTKPSNFEKIIDTNLGLPGGASKVDLGRLETGANSCASR